MSSQQDVCRNDASQLEEHQQEQISGQVDHTPQEALTFKGNQDTYNFNDVQEEEEEPVSNEHMEYVIVS